MQRPMAILAGLFMSIGAAHASPPVERLDFDVFRGESQIGRHTLQFSEDGEAVEVRIDIDLEVKFAFLTLFDYDHANTEVWRDGRLYRIETQTNRNGDAEFLRMQAAGDGLTVDGSRAEAPLLPASVVPTSYWNKQATLSQSSLLDSQNGRLLDIEVSEVGVEEIMAWDRTIEASRYRIDGELQLDLWYDANGVWVKLEFLDETGTPIEYVLRPPAPTTLAQDAG